MTWRALGAWVVLLAAGCGDDDAPADAAVDAGVDASTVDASFDAGPPVLVFPEDREACADRDPNRRPYFGDLHVHTSLSFDAVTFDVRVRPRDVYAFARGEPLPLPPYAADGTPTRTLTLSRPLDFAAVTDHAEFLAEVPLCWVPGSPGYDSTPCVQYRNGDHESGDFGSITGTFLTNPPRRPPLCSLEPDACRAAREATWAEIMDAAEAAYDRTSACTFTSFVGYEWTAAPSGTNIHRNVLFRGRTVPRTPTSFIEAPTPVALWDALDATCLETGTACDALVIPHNSNLGAGTMFVPETRDGAPYDRATAERRARMEPLVEIYQHKGASECLFEVPDPLASEDELCSFERLHPTLCAGGPSDPPDCTDSCERGGGVGFLGGCVSGQDFVRGALRVGMLELVRTGANPFAFGFVGSTDTHVGAAGATDEASWPGHQGDSDDDPDEALAVGSLPLVRGFTTSPGGLAVVWAEANERDALFDAMRRRETYGTSGTRIVVRFFGGFGYDAALCDDPELVRRGYEGGVPMGGELGAAPTGTAPSFVVSAMRDPMSAPLAHVQIVKAWVTGASTEERVYDVAGDPASGASVDPATCTPVGAGADTLCTVWTDPDFDPAAPAIYYARVVENPTCRWSQYVCNSLSLDCATITADHPHAACCDPALEGSVEERAWTSPIFYVPGP